MSNYAYVKEWRKKNKDKVKEQAKRYAVKHPDTNKKAKIKYRKNNIKKIRIKEKIAQRIFRKNNPDAQRIRTENYRKRQEIKKVEIAGRPRPTVCELCLEEKYKIVFDHCHEKGHFRGWICDRCNKTLGLIKDSIPLLEKMITYLRNNHGKINNQETQQTS